MTVAKKVVLLFVTSMLLTLAVSLPAVSGQADMHRLRLGAETHAAAEANGAPLAEKQRELQTETLLPAHAQTRLPLPLQTQAFSQQACGQLLANPQLDIVEFGDNTGAAEPWVVLDPIVYYSALDFTSPEYSLFMVEGDAEDPSPEIDSFAQGFLMPEGLTGVLIEYSTFTVNPSAGDFILGDLWSLDQNGNLDEFLFGWDISASEEVAWEDRFVEITDPAELEALQGRPLAVILWTLTDGEAPRQEVFFDDVTITVCVEINAPEPGTLFLPSILRDFGEATGPLCVPPSETPPDQWNANRGLVQTGATCDSRLSSLDRADYYTFRPEQTGNYKLQLRNLPAGTQWSAMIFVDGSSPAYAPGETAGQCRIGTPGAVNKQVTCNLQGGEEYFVKVSSGSTPVAGAYRMMIERP